jgi:hypothetical protein
VPTTGNGFEFGKSMVSDRAGTDGRTDGWIIRYPPYLLFCLHGRQTTRFFSFFFTVDMDPDGWELGQGSGYLVRILVLVGSFC